MSKTRVRIVFFSTWVDGLQDAESYLRTSARRDLRGKVRDPADADLLRMARLDCDWDAECLRAFSAMAHPGLDFAPASIADARGLLSLLSEAAFDESQAWLILIDQKPQALAPVIGRILSAFTTKGGKVLYWAYDDASRNMPCFSESVAPHLSVLIHDEHPLEERGRAALPASCRTLHMSWVANLVPFAYPLREDAEERVVFLGSRLGLTPERLRQIDALATHFGPRFTCITDHSVPVAERARFAGIKVHLCPEGRMFRSPSMSRTHTDRPFWAGCLGQVPVAEDSRFGGRLDALVEAGAILRHPHGDIAAMIESCERALTVDLPRRREIHEYFNRHGVVGPVVAREIAASEGRTETHQVG